MNRTMARVTTAWMHGRATPQGKSLWTDGTHFYSYDTCILAYRTPVQRTPPFRGPVLNDTNYSVTTRRYQNALRAWLYDVLPDPITVVDAPRGCTPTELVESLREQWRTLGGSPPSWNADPAVLT